jgi:hypothetical protein
MKTELPNDISSPQKGKGHFVPRRSGLDILFIYTTFFHGAAIVYNFISLGASVCFFGA